MSGYIPNHQKKKKLFEKREHELMHAIKNKYSTEKIMNAAEHVREAKLQVFKSQFAENSTLPLNKYEPNEKAKQWQEIPLVSIIEQYST